MKNKPYQYVAIWHPTKSEEREGIVPKVYSNGIVVAKSMYNAYQAVAKELTPMHDNDAEQIEVYMKPFMDEESCPTKSDIGSAYSFFAENTIVYWRSSTASLDDFIKDTFTNQENRKLPGNMYLIDIFNLINNDKKNIL